MKVNPFGTALIKKKRQIKLGDAGTINRFSLVFQYQIYKKTNGQKQSQIKIVYKCTKAYAAHTTN